MKSNPTAGRRRPGAGRRARPDRDGDGQIRRERQWDEALLRGELVEGGVSLVRRRARVRDQERDDARREDVGELARVEVEVLDVERQAVRAPLVEVGGDDFEVDPPLLRIVGGRVLVAARTDLPEIAERERIVGGVAGRAVAGAGASGSPEEPPERDRVQVLFDPVGERPRIRGSPRRCRGTCRTCASGAS